MTYVLDVIEANFGRHDTNDSFDKGAAATIAMVKAGAYHEDLGDLGWIAYGISELDEDDGPDEHQRIEYSLAGAGKRTRVGWPTFEPLIIGRNLRVKQPQTTFASPGKAHLSPTRHINHALVYPRTTYPWQVRMHRVGIINHHAPRNAPALAAEIKACREAHAKVQQHYADKGVSFITMGDWNDPDYPVQVPGTKTAVHAGLDYIRYWNAPGGARLSVVATDSAVIGIDPHRAHLARIRVQPPKKGSWPS